MTTGFTGTFVVAWSQTELDGGWATSPGQVRIGSTWSWDGPLVRVDGPGSVLTLGPSRAALDLRRRAGGSVRRLIGGARGARRVARTPATDPLFDHSFTVTDGRGTWEVAVILRDGGHGPLALFVDGAPPRRTDLWVMRHGLESDRTTRTTTARGGVICFTPGTMILTPEGPRDVASLHEGCRVQTQDDGPAEVLWIGRRRVSAARIMATPDLAPVRLRKGALDRDVPDAGLLVSPDHRVVLRGARAAALFNTAEVLVAARDLVDDRHILRDRSRRDVTYIHLMLPRHQIVFANAVATESFHPAAAALDALASEDRDRLFSRMPVLRDDIGAYGTHARRLLTRGEAAVLHADMGRRRPV
ncbi:Hint domain-containing protein [Loktanella fryxellensis]|uniref:Hint domain-containing protein n=1 Tax=Loktanella fryxellensis TaxID=245187 RepID=A0A1H8G7L5_9RHOB|nr:Hint domain-containing protein [Loktanella fryxellensis]SEN39859.1 Hint domain-containing protein [Loktanella fryxellensis]